MAKKTEKIIEQEIKKNVRKAIKNPQKVTLKQGFVLVVLIGAFFLYRWYTTPSQTALPATLSSSNISCVDGDTYWDGDIKIRLLAIDTPESTSTKEAYGEEASARTCDLLNKASKIEYYYDTGNETDKYDRKLYWVYVDGQLLQEILLSEGLAEIKYVDKDTVDKTRLDILNKAQEKAQAQGLGIWSDN